MASGHLGWRWRIVSEEFYRTHHSPKSVIFTEHELRIPMEAIELLYKPFQFNDDEFYAFCQQNSELKLERDADGTIIIMPNTGEKPGTVTLNLIFSCDSGTSSIK